MDGHNRKTIGVEIRESIEALDVGVAISDFRQRHAGHFRNFQRAVARERTDDAEVEYRTIGFGKSRGGFFRESRDCAGFAVPLGPQVIGIFAIVMIVARLEGHGLVEEIARAGVCPSLSEGYLLHGLVPMGIAFPEAGRCEQGVCREGGSLVVKIPLNIRYGAGRAVAPRQMRVRRKAARETDAARGGLRIGSDPFVNAANLKFVVVVGYVAVVRWIACRVEEGVVLPDATDEEPSLSAILCGDFFELSEIFFGEQQADIGAIAFFGFGSCRGCGGGRQDLVATAVIVDGLHYGCDGGAAGGCAEATTRADGDGEDC